MRIHCQDLLYKKRTRINIAACRQASGGFTAVELLAVVAVVGILSVLTVSSIVRGSEGSKRIQCLRNLRQMAQGSLMYAENDSLGRLVGRAPLPNTALDDLNWLHGFGTNYPSGLISDVKIFVCPSTRNRIRNISLPLSGTGAPRTVYVLQDLADNAVSVTANGHSYEVLPNHGAGSPKTTRSVMQFVNSSNPTSVGVTPGPGRTFLFYDAMDLPSPGIDKENYPSPSYNHGAAGGNVGFADGHAEWIGVADWNYRWNLSQDSNRPLTE